MSRLKQSLNKINNSIPNNNKTTKRNRKNKKKRGRGRKDVRGLTESYSLVDTVLSSTVDYAEAVVCPFDDKAVGCKRPDGQVGTVCGTDRFASLLNMTQYASVFSTLTGTELTGFVLTLVPRSIAVGWLQGQLISGTLGSDHVLPNLNIQELDSDFKGLPATEYTSVLSDAYCILFTILGANGKFYRFNSLPGEISEDFTPGINLIRTPRMDSMRDNFDTIRLLGAGMKLWPNSAPINTGGHVYSGAFRLRELYEILAGVSQTSISSYNIESALKDNYKTFAGLDGTTVRYNPLMEIKQTELKQMNMQFTAVTFDVLPDTHFTVYKYNETLATELHDLASANVFVPAIIWRYGNEAVYDNFPDGSTCRRWN
jgi:hypothetical protein